VSGWGGGVGGGGGGVGSGGGRGWGGRRIVGQGGRLGVERWGSRGMGGSGDVGVGRGGVEREETRGVGGVGSRGEGGGGRLGGGGGCGGGVCAGFGVRRWVGEAGRVRHGGLHCRAEAEHGILVRGCHAGWGRTGQSGCFSAGRWGCWDRRRELLEQGEGEDGDGVGWGGSRGWIGGRGRLQGRWGACDALHEGRGGLSHGRGHGAGGGCGQMARWAECQSGWGARSEAV